MNIWDNGFEGNYWSDYNGTDADCDGIGDTPYLIYGSNQDNYPLMNPVVISEVLDTTPPTISIISPENKTDTVTDVPLTFTVNEQILWMGYSLDGQANVTITGNTTLTGLSDGTHSLTVYTRDIARNIGSSDTVYFTIDTILPSISILSPENKTYTTTGISLAFAINESTSWIGYSLDRQANVTITGNTTLSGLTDGSHSLKVHAKDTAGNTGTSETIHFSIAQPSESFPITWVVAAIATIAVVAASLLVYFTKIRKTTGEVEK